MYSTLKRRGNDLFHVVPTWNTCGVFVGKVSRGVFRSLPNIYDGAFFAKIVNDQKPSSIIAKKLHHTCLSGLQIHLWCLKDCYETFSTPFNPFIPSVPFDPSENIRKHLVLTFGFHINICFFDVFQGGQKGTLERKKLRKKLFINFEKSEHTYLLQKVNRENKCL